MSVIVALTTTPYEKINSQHDLFLLLGSVSCFTAGAKPVKITTTCGTVTWTDTDLCEGSDEDKYLALVELALILEKSDCQKEAGGAVVM